MNDYDGDSMSSPDSYGPVSRTRLRTVPRRAMGERPKGGYAHTWDGPRVVVRDDGRTPAQRVTDRMRRQRRDGSDVAWLGRVGGPNQEGVAA